MNTITDSERDVIRRFASGERSLRSHAVSIFREYHRSSADAPEIRFMAEATSLAPDHLLQAHYRRQLVAPNVAILDQGPDVRLSSDALKKRLRS